MQPTEESPRLAPVSYVVLGMISLRGPSTPYELEAAVDKSVAYFWSFPHSQLYREPERLAEFGLLTVQSETGGRRRKVYSLTEVGRSALAKWLTTPAGDVFEMRDEAVLQLFFSDQLSAGELAALARLEVELYERQLATYAQIADLELPRHGADRRMAPLRLGIRLGEAFRDFWAEIADDPPPASPPRPPR